MSHAKINYAQDAWFTYCRFVGGMVAIALLVCIVIGIVGGFQYAISDKTTKVPVPPAYSGSCTYSSNGTVYCTNDSGTVTSK